MRRQHLPVLPLLMSTYPAMKPWELDLYTRDELSLLVRAAKEAADGK